MDFTTSLMQISTLLVRENGVAALAIVGATAAGIK